MDRTDREVEPEGREEVNSVLAGWLEQHVEQPYHLTEDYYLSTGHITLAVLIILLCSVQGGPSRYF